MRFFNFMISYSHKLKDPRWQKIRLEVLVRDNFTCDVCGAIDKTLHVHHLCYNESHNPWDSDLNALQTLCSDCHLLEHYKGTKLEELLLSNFTMLTEMFSKEYPSIFSSINIEILKIINES